MNRLDQEAQRFDHRKFSLYKYEMEGVSSYVDLIMNDEIDKLVEAFLARLYIFQRRLYKNSPRKLCAQRRYVMGLRQARKCLKIGTCQLLLLSPDIDEIYSSLVEELKQQCREIKVPYLYSLSKSGYKRVLHLSGSPVSAVTITSQDGANDLCLEILRAASHEN